MSIPREAIEGIHQLARETKDRMWSDHGMGDMNPQMLAIYREAGPKMTPLTELVGALGQVMDDPIPVAVLTTLEALTDEHAGHGAPVGDVVEKLVLHLDGRSREVTGATAEEALAKVQRGDLHQDYESNPFSDVRELLMTFVYEDDLVGGVDVTCIRQKYGKEDGGSLRWDEPDFFGPDDDDSAQGLIHEMLVKFFNSDREVKSSD